MGQEAPQLSVSAQEEPPLLTAEVGNPKPVRESGIKISQGPRDPDHPLSDSGADSDGAISPGAVFPFAGVPHRSLRNRKYKFQES
jgi:hypothetical protein